MLLRSGGRGLRCDLPSGESVRILPAYRVAAWNAAECQAFKQAVRPGSVALDIGANVGAYSLLLGQWVGTKGKVFAFEPTPETFSALTQHVRLNHLEGIVLPQCAAISDQIATLDFFSDGFRGTNRLLSGNEVTSATLCPSKVKVLTIDEFCSMNHVQPDFIKIDIEGFELAALRGARETVRNGRGHLALFVEMHPITWRTIGCTRAEMLAELDRQGLQVEPLVSGGDPWENQGAWVRLTAKASF